MNELYPSGTFCQQNFSGTNFLKLVPLMAELIWTLAILNKCRLCEQSEEIQFGFPIENRFGLLHFVRKDGLLGIVEKMAKVQLITFTK